MAMFKVKLNPLVGGSKNNGNRQSNLLGFTVFKVQGTWEIQLADEVNLDLLSDLLCEFTQSDRQTRSDFNIILQNGSLFAILSRAEPITFQ